ncbi:MAG: hypothetical protein AABZ07_04415 [Nitrospirota bacterium]
MGTNIKKKMGIIILLVTLPAILWGSGRIDAGEMNFKKDKERGVLGKAQIIVYKKGEKILIDPNAPYFKELQLAGEEMLTPLEPRSVTLDGFLKSLHPSEMRLPDANELHKNGLSISIVYEEKIKTFITAGFGPAAAPTSEINLSEIILPLSGDLTRIRINWAQTEYSCNYLYLISDFDQNQFVTTRDVKKIRTILSQYAIIP